MSVKLLTEQGSEFLSLKGGCKGLSESALVKILHCWISHVMAHMIKMVTLLSDCGSYWMDCILFFISGITVTKT